MAQHRNWKIIQKLIDDVGLAQTVIESKVPLSAIRAATRKGKLVVPKRRRSYTIPELRVSVARSQCVSDVCKALNITVCTFNYKKINTLCEEYDISMDHFDISRTLKRGKKQWTMDTAFVANSTCIGSQLRRVAIRFGLYTGTCALCHSNDQWHGKVLTLEYDHINGINNDNRLKNLRWLCPNCHSQTSTYRNSKNRLKKSL